jgi:hypothetical protein
VSDFRIAASAPFCESDLLGIFKRWECFLNDLHSLESRFWSLKGAVFWCEKMKRWKDEKMKNEKMEKLWTGLVMDTLMLCWIGTKKKTRNHCNCRFDICNDSDRLLRGSMLSFTSMQIIAGIVTKLFSSTWKIYRLIKLPKILECYWPWKSPILFHFLKRVDRYCDSKIALGCPQNWKIRRFLSHSINLSFTKVKLFTTSITSNSIPAEIFTKSFR